MARRSHEQWRKARAAMNASIEAPKNDPIRIPNLDRPPTQKESDNFRRIANPVAIVGTAAVAATFATIVLDTKTVDAQGPIKAPPTPEKPKPGDLPDWANKKTVAEMMADQPENIKSSVAYFGVTTVFNEAMSHNFDRCNVNPGHNENSRKAAEAFARATNKEAAQMIKKARIDAFVNQKDEVVVQTMYALVEVAGKPTLIIVNNPNFVPVGSTVATFFRSNRLNKGSVEIPKHLAEQFAGDMKKALEAPRIEPDDCKDNQPPTGTVPAFEFDSAFLTALAGLLGLSAVAAFLTKIGIRIPLGV